MNSYDLLQKLHHAMNRHDLEAFVSLFSTDYHSEQPAHPGRTFQGREQVRKNWGLNFSEMPDFQSLLVHYETTETRIWVEWEWRGTRQDGSSLHMKGICIFGISAQLISWGRLYMEPVEKHSADIDTAMRTLVGGSHA